MVSAGSLLRPAAGWPEAGKNGDRATPTVRAVPTEHGLPVEGARAQGRTEFTRPSHTTGGIKLRSYAFCSFFRP